MKFFNIFPIPNDNRHFEVNIYESRIDLLNYLNTKRYPPYVACIEYYSYEPNSLGKISFERARLSLSTIFHECLHAAIWYVKSTNEFKMDIRGFFESYSPNSVDRGLNEVEERLASIQEYLFWQIHNRERGFEITLKEAKENLEHGLAFYFAGKNDKTESKQLELDL